MADRAAGPPPARWLPAVAVAGIAVLVAAVLVPLSMGRPGGPTGVPGPTWTTMPADRGAAVPVEGIGYLIRDVDGRIRLCARALTIDIGGRPTCAGVSVPTTGVDEALLPVQRGRMRVEGRYQGGTLAVVRVIGPAGDVDEPWTSPPMPCTAPAGGWRPGNGFPDPGDESEASRRVGELVEAEPDRFSGVWHWETGTATNLLPGEVGPSVSVTVVGTTGDVARARAELSALYEGNLCVHDVRYSSADLGRIAEQLRELPVPSVSAETDVAWNRVRVMVVALNPPTVAKLDEVGRDALILEEPLLQWLE